MSSAQKYTFVDSLTGLKFQFRINKFQTDRLFCWALKIIGCKLNNGKQLYSNTIPAPRLAFGHLQLNLHGAAIITNYRSCWYRCYWWRSSNVVGGCGHDSVCYHTVYLHQEDETVSYAYDDVHECHYFYCRSVAVQRQSTFENVALYRTSIKKVYLTLHAAISSSTSHIALMKKAS